MSTTNWGPYRPGQEVSLAHHLGSGRIMGGLYAGASRPVYRVQRAEGGAVEVGAGSIVSASAAPEYDVGDRVRVRWGRSGTVTAKSERQDAPGFVYVVQVANRSRFTKPEPSTLTVGAEQITGALP